MTIVTTEAISTKAVWISEPHRSNEFYTKIKGPSRKGFFSEKYFRNGAVLEWAGKNSHTRPGRMYLWRFAIEHFFCFGKMR
jgi:hypothetical protein